eukprot:jgi/Tetstr1/450145/TSEL_037187.t1
MGAFADSTRTSYAYSWNDWVKWCGGRTPPLYQPRATAMAVAMYLQFRAECRQAYNMPEDRVHVVSGPRFLLAIAVASEPPCRCVVGLILALCLLGAMRAEKALVLVTWARMEEHADGVVVYIA